MPKKNSLTPTRYMISAEYWIPEIGEHLTYSLIFYAGCSIRKNSDFVQSYVRKLNDVCYSYYLNAELVKYYLIKG